MGTHTLKQTDNKYATEKVNVYVSHSQHLHVRCQLDDLMPCAQQFSVYTEVGGKCHTITPGIDITMFSLSRLWVLKQTEYSCVRQGFAYITTL